MLYIKKDIHGHYIESETAVDTLNGYEDSVGTTWEDYLNGKFLLLSPEQIAFHNEFPGLSIENVWFMTQPTIVEKTLMDVKNDMIAEVETYYDSPEINAINVNGLQMYFDENECGILKMQIETCERGGESEFKLKYNGTNFTVPVWDGYNVINEMVFHRYKNINTKNGKINSIMAMQSIDDVEKFDVIANAPVAPDVVVTIIPEDVPSTGETPVMHHINFKLMDCSADNEILEVADGSEYAVTITPDYGFAIKRDDFVAMMGDDNVSVQFADDIYFRPEYASYVYVSIKSVTADVNIATLGYPIDGEPEVKEPEKPEEPQVIDEPEQPTAETYYISYKLDKCQIDNDIVSVNANNGWKTGIYPYDGHAIHVPDVIAEMGGKPLYVEFNDDVLGRNEYASAAFIHVDNVVGDIFISIPAHEIPKE